MIQNLQNALLITAIGMGLVFLAIILLWGLMSLIARFGADHQNGSEADSQPAPIEESSPVPTVDLKKQAAAAAVAVALSMQKSTGARTSAHPAAVPSNWQAVMRARDLQTKGRGSAR